jgi:hypothetical protein
MEIRGHVFCSFLALCIRKKLFDKLEKRNWKLEWEQIVQDVDAITEVTVTHAQKEFVIRTEARGVAGKVFQAAGVGRCWATTGAARRLNYVHYNIFASVTD